MSKLRNSSDSSNAWYIKWLITWLMLLLAWAVTDANAWSNYNTESGFKRTSITKKTSKSEIDKIMKEISSSWINIDDISNTSILDALSQVWIENKKWETQAAIYYYFGWDKKYWIYKKSADQNIFTVKSFKKLLKDNLEQANLERDLLSSKSQDDVAKWVQTKAASILVNSVITATPDLQAKQDISSPVITPKVEETKISVNSTLMNTTPAWKKYSELTEMERLKEQQRLADEQIKKQKASSSSFSLSQSWASVVIWASDIKAKINVWTFSAEDKIAGTSPSEELLKRDNKTWNIKWISTATAQLESTNNWRVELGVLWDINEAKNDFRLTASYRMLYASQQLWTYIWIERWSELEKYVLAQWFKIPGWKILVTWALLKSLVNVNFSEINMSKDVRMTQYAWWIDVSKWFDKDKILNEIKWSVVYYNVEWKKLWVLNNIIIDDAIQYDWTEAYGWVRWWDKLIAEFTAVWKLSEKLRLDTNFWYERTQIEWMYDTSKEIINSPVAWAKLTIDMGTHDRIYWGYDYTKSAKTASAWYRHDFGNNISAFVNWTYVDNSWTWAKDDKRVLAWVEGRFEDLSDLFGSKKKSRLTPLFSNQAENDKLTLDDITPNSRVTTNEIQIKVPVIYKDHIVNIDKTSLSAWDTLDKNLDGTLKALVLDNWWFAISSINAMSDNEYAPYIQIIWWKLAIVDFKWLNNFMKLKWYTIWQTKTINLSVNDASWISVYSITITKWSVEIKNTVKRQFNVPPALAAQFVSWQITFEQLVAALSNTAPVPTYTSFTMNEDAVKNWTLTATDANNDVLTYGTSVNPTHWTVVVQSNGNFIYTPNADYFWTDTFTYSVSDGKATVTQVVTVTINNMNDAPVFWTLNNLNIANWIAMTPIILPVVTDADGDTIIYSLTWLPSWLSFDASTRTISWTPTSLWTTAVSYRANDGTVTTIWNFNIIVWNTAPVSTAISDMQANESTAFSYNTSVHFSDPNGDVLSCSWTWFPAWISVNPSTCVISGNLPAVSSDTPYSITITATDPSNATTSRTFTLTVKDVAVLPTSSFASSTVTKLTTDWTFTNTFTTNSSWAVTYSSSNTAVATVNSSTWLVTIVWAWTATITANQAAASWFTADSDSYSLTVNLPDAPSSAPTLTWDTSYDTWYSNTDKIINWNTFKFTWNAVAWATWYDYFDWSIWIDVGNTLSMTSNNWSEGTYAIKVRAKNAWWTWPESNIGTVVIDRTNPTVVWETTSTAYNTALTWINVLSNDSDAHTPLSIWTISSQTWWTFVVNSWKIDFTPTTWFSWSASCVYQVIDAAGNISTATLTVNVSANVAPTASNFTLWTNVWNAAKTFDWKVLSSAADANGDSLTASVQTNWTKWTFVVSWTNVTYTPNAWQTWSDTCTLRISDGNWWTVNITITVNWIDTLAPTSLSWSSSAPDTQWQTYTWLQATVNENLNASMVWQSWSTSKWWSYTITWISWTTITFNYTAPNWLSWTPAQRTDVITMTLVDTVWNSTTNTLSTSPLATLNTAPTWPALSDITTSDNAWGGPITTIVTSTWVTDANWDTLTYSATWLPSWLSINSSTWDITWTYDSLWTTIHNITVTVSDGNWWTLVRSFVLTITDAG